MTEGVVVDGVSERVVDVRWESFSKVEGYLNHFLEEETKVAHIDGFDCHFGVGRFATDGRDEDKFVGCGGYAFNFLVCSLTDGGFLGARSRCSHIGWSTST